MGIIKELSPLLTNQIAAGEVIERPASVVKELIENSLDAQASRIHVAIKEAGLTAIEITDNGLGMTPEDAVLSIKRHTTSKISDSHDLFSIGTLGFRGEALASITAVSKLTLTTAQEDGQGTQVVVEGGQIISQDPLPAAKGTKILVQDLFYNTPARLKFVKSLSTELSHITEVVHKAALAHPQVAFVLSHDGNELFRTHGRGGLVQAIAGVYGTSIARTMMPFQAETDDFSIQGYTSLPQDTRANRSHMTLLVNGRPIRNLAIQRAILAAYGSTLMVGRFPITILSLTMDYQLVDVNVHPTKQEVRLSFEKELGDLVKDTLHQVIYPQQRVPQNSLDAFLAQLDQEEDNLSQNPPVSKPTKPQQMSLDWSLASPDPGLDLSKKDDVHKDPGSQPVKELVEEALPSFGDSFEEEPPASSSVREEDQDKADQDSLEDLHGNQWDYLEMAKSLDGEKLQAHGFPELHYLAQLHGTYLLAQNQQGLYLVDQHAAQERIAYEANKKALNRVQASQQSLMIPLVLHFSKSEFIRVVDILPKLQELGLEVDLFGQQDLQVSAYPTWIPKAQLRAVVESLIDYLLKDQQVTPALLLHATAVMMACKRSIKANHHLSDWEARQLLVDLAKCDNPYNCPHGRPVMVLLTAKDLEKMFKRIQDPHRSLFANDNEEGLYD